MWLSIAAHYPLILFAPGKTQELCQQEPALAEIVPLLKMQGLQPSTDARELVGALFYTFMITLPAYPEARRTPT